MTVTAEPDPEPSPTPELHAIASDLSGTRELLLYSGGVLIFLTGIVALRSRKA